MKVFLSCYEVHNHMIRLGCYLSTDPRDMVISNRTDTVLVRYFVSLPFKTTIKEAA